MKKIVTLLLALCALICIGITIASCDNGDTPKNECSHTYGEWIPERIETCGLTGQYRRYCTLCSHSEEKEVPATNQHKPTYSVTPGRTDPTCTSTGSISATFCEVCGTHLTERIELDFLPHNYVNYKCTGCGKFDDGVYPIGARVESWDDSYNIVAKLTANDNGETYTLKISGKGETVNFSEDAEFPWNDVKEQITSVIVENGSDTEKITYLGHYLFAGLNAVTSVTLPDSVTSIGKAVFKGCSSLKTATLPEALTVLPDYTFEGCEALTTVEMSDAIIEMGEAAFANCKSLENAIIPKKLTQIPERTFSGCVSLTEVVLSQKIETIGSSAFSECEKLRVVFAESVHTVKDRAFYACSNLIDISFPSLNVIEANAFADCVGLVEFDFGHTSRIDELAFAGCENLKTISFLGGGAVKLYAGYYEYAFYDLTIEEIYLTDVSKWLNSNLNVALGDDTKIFVNDVLLENLVVPNDISEIVGTFNGYTYLKSVELHDRVTSIPDTAFAGTSITELVIPASVEYLGYRFVDGCINLKKLTVPFIGPDRNYEEYDNMVISSKAFGTNLTSLKELVITGPADASSSNMYRIPNRAFSSSLPLETLRIGEKVHAVGEYCFQNMTSLKNIYFDNINITEFGSGAFYDCSEIENVYVTTNRSSEDCIDIWLAISFADLNSSPVANGVAKLYFDGELLTHLNLTGKSCTLIPAHSFNGYGHLTSVTLCESVTEIGTAAFYRCAALESITIRQNLVTVGDSAFAECTALTTISYGAFSDPQDTSVDPIFEEEYKNYAIAKWRQISFGYAADPLTYATKFFIVTYEGVNGAADTVREINISELQ